MDIDSLLDINSISKRLILAVDFSNNVFGSYYGESLINSKGINLNAVKGFFFRLQSLKNMFNPDYIVMGIDIDRNKTFRRKLYKPYKAHRKEKDDDIINQLKLTMRLCALLGYPMLSAEPYEADDIIGMISKYGSENNIDTVIVSSDKDYYQLLSDNTYVFSPRNKELLDSNWLYEKYKLTPQQWIDLKILQGDKSDNIPGIDGVGEVTGLKLMNEFKNIETIYQNIKYLKPSLQENFRKREPFIPISKELVTIVTDYTKIDLKPKMLERDEIFDQEIFSLLRELELNSLYNVMNYSLIPEKEELT